MSVITVNETTKLVLDLNAPAPAQAKDVAYSIEEFGWATGNYWFAPHNAKPAEVLESFLEFS